MKFTFPQAIDNFCDNFSQFSDLILTFEVFVDASVFAHPNFLQIAETVENVSVQVFYVVAIYRFEGNFVRKLQNFKP